mmetsp:Transcript_6292/g.14580  ORF Transcript_6292/g.14580 Transcript_6292/m.14580 type:complete len:404 (+) Transcript_6292:52-1263(+)
MLRGRLIPLVVSCASLSCCHAAPAGRHQAAFLASSAKLPWHTGRLGACRGRPLSMESPRSPRSPRRAAAPPGKVDPASGGKGGAAAPALLASQPRHITLEDGFLTEQLAANLRGTFDRKFAEPRSTGTDRFCWDYWHVPDQYTLVRTPADAYFDEPDFAALTEALTDFGQRTLGCNAITQPWLSYYVDGCEQRMHTDSWHGPFAYVLSLTPWETRQFRGGETFILEPALLDYWRGFDPTKGLEESKLTRTVDPCFNRLTIFDPRLPHGVREVRGTRDPREARLVLHGWFTDLGTPFFEGGLKEEQATDTLNDALEPLYEQLGQCERCVGVLIVRLSVDALSGKVTKLVSLADTLLPDPQEMTDGTLGSSIRAEILSVIHQNLSKLQFGPASEDSSITIPFVFE